MNVNGYEIKPRADLRGADLSGADLDFSCLPLWCGSKGMIVDKRLFAQFAAHLCAMICTDEEVIYHQFILQDIASQSHRAKDLGIEV
jgi:hypothetical protein